MVERRGCPPSQGPFTKAPRLSRLQAIYDSQGDLVAEVKGFTLPEKNRSNAELILKALNSHEANQYRINELTHALNDLLSFVQEQNQGENRSIAETRAVEVVKEGEPATYQHREKSYCIL